MYWKNASRPRTIHCVTQCLLISSVLWLTGCAEDTPSIAEEYDPTTTIEEYTVTAAALAPDATDEEADAEVAALVRFNNEIALDLFRYTQSGNGSSNDVLATYGVNQLLAMSAAGAADITAEEYRGLLDAFPDTSIELSALPLAVQRLNRQLGMQGDDATSTFELTNTARFQMGYRFRKDFLSTLRNAFDAQLEGAFFTNIPADTAPAPSFASEIVSLSDSSQFYDEMTRLSLLSTTTLANPWNLPEADRFDGLFEGFDGIQQWVPMLRWQGSFKTYANDALRAVELPLGESGKALLMVTPKPGRYNDVFDNLQQHLTEMTPAMAAQETVVYLPEFSISESRMLTDYMQSLGLDSAFIEGDGTSCGTGCRANFSAINGLGYLYLSSPEQVSQITVDGDAVEADSKNTLVMLGTKDEPPEVWWSSGAIFSYTDFVLMVENCTSTYTPEGEPQVQPFLFVIRDMATNTILYLGQVRSLDGPEAGSWQCAATVDDFSGAATVDDFPVFEQYPTLN